MDFSSVLSDTYISGEELAADYNNVIRAQKYCAASQVYCRYIEHNREEAELMYSQFRMKNDKIFKSALEFLDIAIDNANVEITEAALAIIETMKSVYPKYYAAYYNKMFANLGG